jgi:hypothetical protein
LPSVKFERLVIEAGPNTFSLLLHRRLTVIAGLSAVEREAITGELIGSLGTGRPEVHVEVVQASGRRLAVFRPEGARHRVIDVATPDGRDVTGEFLNGDGDIDLFHHHGLDPVRARRMLRLSHADLQAGAAGDEAVRRLAEVDQTQLWSAAARARVTDDELTHEAGTLGIGVEDDEVVNRIERHHARVESALEHHHRWQTYTAFVALIAVAVGLIVSVFEPSGALPIFGIGIVTGVMAIAFRFQVWRAERAELAVLRAAGSESYLSFQLQRVDGLLSNENGRRRLLNAAEIHRSAAERWAQIAGDVSVEWAMERHEEITATARLRHDMSMIGALSSSPSTGEDHGAAELARAIVSRLAAVRTLGRAQEGFPLVLDEPFEGVAPEAKPVLLELLGRTSGSPQMVLFTSDEDVASWARLEALTGELTILEPGAMPSAVGREETRRSNASTRRL